MHYIARRNFKVPPVEAELPSGLAQLEAAACAGPSLGKHFALVFATSFLISWRRAPFLLTYASSGIRGV